MKNNIPKIFLKKINNTLDIFMIIQYYKNILIHQINQNKGYGHGK